MKFILGFAIGAVSANWENMYCRKPNLGAVDPSSIKNNDCCPHEQVDMNNPGIAYNHALQGCCGNEVYARDTHECCGYNSDTWVQEKSGGLDTEVGDVSATLQANGADVLVEWVVATGATRYNVRAVSMHTSTDDWSTFADDGDMALSADLPPIGLGWVTGNSVVMTGLNPGRSYVFLVNAMLCSGPTQGMVFTLNLESGDLTNVGTTAVVSDSGMSVADPENTWNFLALGYWE